MRAARHSWWHNEGGAGVTVLREGFVEDGSVVLFSGVKFGSSVVNIEAVVVPTGLVSVGFSVDWKPPVAESGLEPLACSVCLSCCTDLFPLGSVVIFSCWFTFAFCDLFSSCVLADISSLCMRLNCAAKVGISESLWS